MTEPETDTRPRVETTKPINLTQLTAEMGGVGLTAGDGVVVVADAASPTTQKQLADAVAAHVADPAYGKPAEDTQLATIRAKAQQVWAGTATFTAAEVQKILAAIVLRATR